MDRKSLIDQIRKKKSCLCIGLDTDIDRLPAHFEKSAASVFQFNKEIIDATSDLCVAYKINTAFYEALGAEGWDAMEQTVKYIPDDHFIIADAKRGDIGNTTNQYAKAFFSNIPFDAITVSPYMGEDSIRPFLEYKNKWVIILALTSNQSSSDFQQISCNGNKLWEQVLKTTSIIGSLDNMMYVIGATKATELEKVRAVIPDHFLLIPGVGAQGGNIADVLKNGRNNDIGLLINVSRAVIFAGSGTDFGDKARQTALSFRNQMKEYL